MRLFQQESPPSVYERSPSQWGPVDGRALVPVTLLLPIPLLPQGSPSPWHNQRGRCCKRPRTGGWSATAPPQGGGGRDPRGTHQHGNKWVQTETLRPLSQTCPPTAAQTSTVSGQVGMHTFHVLVYTREASERLYRYKIRVPLPILARECTSRAVASREVFSPPPLHTF